ncbi:MAG: hypothetical protein NTW19_21180 [Planctomycetota bacterium]|nr:hypothetical protein [Planctomycetota bacterium]
MSPSSRPADGHALRFEGCVTNIHEAPVLGNGELAAAVQLFQDEFRLHLGKTDVFDARFDFDTKASIFRQEAMIRASRDFGFRLEGSTYGARPAWDRTPPPELAYPDDKQGWDRHVFPCPKPAGLVRILHSGSHSTQIETVVDIAKGTVRSRFAMEFDWHGRGELEIEAFVEAERNVVRMRVTRRGNLGHFWLLVEKPIDRLDASMPLPEVKRDGDWAGTVTQRVPAGFGAEAFAWHLEGAFAKPGPGRTVGPVEAQVYALAQRCALEPGQSVEWEVAVRTDRAPRRQRPAPKVEAFEPARDRQASRWGKFWEASDIELEDKALEATWHRNLYSLACHIPPGDFATAPGLCANLPVYDKSPWHGVYTVNMNIQKMFLASLPTGHPEWIENYAGWLDDMRPSFALLARETFGIDGIYSPHMVLPWVKPERQFSTNTCGRALGMTGWHGQPLWWHWEFTRDKKFLAERGYPYLRDAAEFYRQYLDKFTDESGDIYPSLILEAPPWSRGMARNRDCFTDLILIRKSFEWAIDAAAALGIDEEKQAGWRAAMARVRPMRWEQAPTGETWIASDKGAPTPDPSWWSEKAKRAELALPAAWSVFPGEWVDGDEPDGFAAAAREVMTRSRWEELHPEIVWIHHWWCALPALRLGLPRAFENARRIILQERFPAGHARTTQWVNLQPEAWRCVEDNYLGVAATTEMLLQSQGRVLRLFPCWPREKAARFRALRARGGFVVDASWDPRDGLAAKIRSLAGETMRLRWPGGLHGELLGELRVERGGRAVDVKRDGRDWVWATHAGEEDAVSSR